MTLAQHCPENDDVEPLFKIIKKNHKHDLRKEAFEVSWIRIHIHDLVTIITLIVMLLLLVHCRNKKVLFGKYATDDLTDNLPQYELKSHTHCNLLIFNSR